MSNGGFPKARLDRMYDALSGYVERGEDEIKPLPDMGPKALGCHRNALAARGLSFAEDAAALP